eukprot:CAMPEP_0117451712 /NCGR_PEP_ID=MMETSP0759-20121206/9161_1 /TAXON_ID=63605 /ORGANISM="Percolomonas cosmopolitus, Strain WS" /LENGTH=407 /DNA_ID=CAMNT_0005244345 /DNA_START=39 /DNA_END=1262 /DNA_ORIENTATION=-
MTLGILKHFVNVAQQKPFHVYTHLNQTSSRLHSSGNTSHLSNWTLSGSKAALVVLLIGCILLFVFESCALDWMWQESLLWSLLNPSVLVACLFGVYLFDAINVLRGRRYPVRSSELILLLVMVPLGVVAPLVHPRWNIQLLAADPQVELKSAETIWNLIHSRGSIPIMAVLFVAPMLTWLVMLRWKNALLSAVLPSCFASIFLLFKHVCVMLISYALVNSDTLLSPVLFASLFIALATFFLLVFTIHNTIVQYSWLPAFPVFCVSTSFLNFFFGMLVLDEWSSTHFVYNVLSIILLLLLSVCFMGVSLMKTDLSTALQPVQHQRDREFLMHVSNLDLGEFDEQDDDDQEAFLEKEYDSANEDVYDNAPGLEMVQNLDHGLREDDEPNFENPQSEESGEEHQSDRGAY